MQKQKNIKSPCPIQQNISETTRTQIKSSQLSLRGTLKRYKRPKQFELTNKGNNFSASQESTKMEEGSFCSNKNNDQVLITKISRVQDKCVEERKEMRFSTKKQTFKDFIKKIQMYNKNKIINQSQTSQQETSPSNSQINLHNTQICIHSTQKCTIFDQLSLEMVDKKSRNQPSFMKYAQNCPFQIRTKQLKTKENFRNNKFIIHQGPNKSQCNWLQKRSKTEQEIKLDITELENATKIIDDSKKLKQDTENQKKAEKAQQDLGNFYITNSKRLSKPMSHISLKLMQKYQTQDQKDSHCFNTDQRLKTADSSNAICKFRDKDLNKHKKLLQTKYSKIRIRFGASLYNKNLWRFDSKTKESLRKQFESICTEDLIAINHKQRDRKPSINSIFCENKILEAQNAFIQKRRLIPSTGNQFREDTIKTNKRFFSLTNSFKRHKTMEFEGRPQKLKKGENINGWQIFDDGHANDKIQDFF